MKISSTWKWLGLALLGLLVAAGVAVAASNLVSEQIGIASESVSAGDRLAPVVNSAAQVPAREPASKPEPATPPETTESDDHGGDDHGSDDDSGGDDHGGEDHSGHGGGGDDD